LVFPLVFGGRRVESFPALQRNPPLHSLSCFEMRRIPPPSFPPVPPRSSFLVFLPVKSGGRCSFQITATNFVLPPFVTSIECFSFNYPKMTLSPPPRRALNNLPTLLLLVIAFPFQTVPRTRALQNHVFFQGVLPLQISPLNPLPLFFFAFPSPTKEPCASILALTFPFPRARRFFVFFFYRFWFPKDFSQNLKCSFKKLAPFFLFCFFQRGLILPRPISFPFTDFRQWRFFFPFAFVPLFLRNFSPPLVHSFACSF